MKRSILPLAILLGLSAMVLFAADFWAEKDYAQWNEDEVDKMLRNSPWAKTVRVTMGGSGGGMPYSGGGGGGRGGGGGMPGGGGIADASSGGMGGGGGGRRGGGGMGGDNMAARPTMNLQVRWVSALPVRHALVRANCGTEIESECANRLLNLEDERFILSIAGMPSRMMRGGQRGGRPGEAERTGPPSSEQIQARRQQMIDRLTEMSTLNVKGKEPLHPNLVQVGDGPAPDIYLFFPGCDWNLTVEDKAVDFEMKMPFNTVRQKFKLKDMMYEGQLEL